MIYLATPQSLETLAAKGDVKFMGVILGVSLHCLVSSYQRELRAEFLTGGRTSTLKHRDGETDRENAITFPAEDRMAPIYFPHP